MTPLYAFTIIMIVIAIGNMIAVKTKSIISMLFAVSIFFLLAFWLGLPTTIFEDSTLLQFGSMMILILLVHMGTTMNLSQLKKQWRTVLIALGAIVGVVIGVIGVGQFFVGFEAAMVSAAPISGGVIAGIIMGEAATEIGLPELAILASLLVVVQGLVGYPIASYVLKKEATKIRSNFHKTNQTVEKPDNSVPKETITIDPDANIKDVPKKYQSDDWFLAKAALIGSLAMLTSQLIESTTGVNILDANILSLLYGVLFHHFNLIGSAPLIKSRSYGVALAGITVVVLSSLAEATPELLLNLLPTILTTLFLGAVFIIIISIIVGRILKESMWMSIGIGISALFGFPGTVIVPNEVANSVGETEEESQAILEYIQPKMLVAGFITVSIASVVLAGILAPILVG